MCVCVCVCVCVREREGLGGEGGGPSIWCLSESWMLGCCVQLFPPPLGCGCHRLLVYVLYDYNALTDLCPLLSIGLAQTLLVPVLLLRQGDDVVYTLREGGCF